MPHCPTTSPCSPGGAGATHSPAEHPSPLPQSHRGPSLALLSSNNSLGEFFLHVVPWHGASQRKKKSVSWEKKIKKEFQLLCCF